MTTRTAAAIQSDITAVSATRQAAYKAGEWDKVDRIQLSLDALNEELETAQRIAHHQDEIRAQRARMTPTAATSTLFLAGQRIRACEAAITVLRGR